MSTAYITPAELAEARRLQHLTLTSLVAVYRPGATSTIGFSATTARELVYSGPGRIFRGSDQTRDSIAAPGDQPLTTAIWVAAIPWDAPPPKPGDVFSVLSGPDDALLDATWRVTDVEASDLVTVRRFRCLREDTLP